MTKRMIETGLPMKQILFLQGIVLIVCLLTAGPLLAEETSLVFHSYKAESKEITREYFVSLRDLDDDQKFFSRRIQGKNCMINDEIILNQEYETQQWKRTCPEDNTEFSGEREGDTFFIKGKLKGRPLNTKIKLADRPFYIIPKLNLTHFALSDTPQIKFWTLRRDTLVKLLMQAEKKGEETIVVNGKKVAAVKILYSATGLRKKYYSRDYYFRKSDGLFIKKVEPDGSTEELVQEE